MPLKTSLQNLSPYQRFALEWKDGCGSNCCPPIQLGTKVVLCRGQLPCDILLVGEGPGESENALGEPFCGPAGHLLDRIVERALAPWDGKARVAYTNIVCCIPRDEDGGKATEPDDDQVKCCQPRLEAFIALANPRLLVCVGKLAKDWLDPGYRHSVKLPREIPQVHLLHPAYILRQSIAHRGLLIQRCEVQIRTAVEDYLTWA